MVRFIYRMRTLDFLSIGVVLGQIAFIIDILCIDLSLGVLHGNPIYIKLWGFPVSYYPGLLALAMLIFGKRDVLEQRHANKKWVKTILFARWVMMLYWTLQFIKTAGIAILDNINRGFAS